MYMALRLDDLELTNFHQFEHYSVNFDENLTVLVGNNGSGKSSILSAASVAAGTFLYGLGESGKKGLSRRDARVASYDMGGSVDRQEQYPVIVSARGLIGDGELRDWSRSLNSENGRATILGARNVVNFSHEIFNKIRDGNNEIILPIIVHYGTDRLWLDTRLNIPKRHERFSRQDGYKNALTASANSRSMLSWFFNMTVQDFQRAQSIRPGAPNPLFAAVRRAVEECFERITESKSVRVTYNLNVDDLDVEYIDKYGKINKILMGILSDGYKTTLCTVADIAYRMAVLNPMLGDDVLSTPGIVMIDEIDLHLHPLWQARILGDLLAIFPNVQFIVTTHAPLVISSVSSKHVRILDGGDLARTPSSELYGSDAGSVLTLVMGATERPREVQDKLNEFYSILDYGEFNRARTILDDLEQEMGETNTSLVAARTALSLEEEEARYAAD